jgi:hypothetical protein
VEQRVIFLNVPARHSKGYFDYLYANIPKHHIVFVDALFGGLDVAARLKWSNDTAETYIVQQTQNLILGNRPEEATIAKVAPFFDNQLMEIRENFIIVICLQQYNMREDAHQRAFEEFLKRSGIQKYLRFAGVVMGFEKVGELKVPFYLNDEDMRNATAGQIVILEFSLKSLDQPRFIVMDKLQQFPGVQATRTFFGVNYGVEETPDRVNPAGKVIDFVKNWSGTLLNWRRFFGI